MDKKETSSTDKIKELTNVISPLNVYDIILRVMKYLIEGIIIIVVALYLSKNKGLPTTRREITDAILLGVIAAAIFAILDTFVPVIGDGGRLGVGFYIGKNIAQMGGGL